MSLTRKQKAISRITDAALTGRSLLLYPVNGPRDAKRVVLASINKDKVIDRSTGRNDLQDIATFRVKKKTHYHPFAEYLWRIDGITPHEAIKLVNDKWAHKK